MDTKTEHFECENQKTDLKNGQNRKTPMPPSVSGVLGTLICSLTVEPL